MHPSPEQPELTPLERSLAALAPSRSLLDRDRLMYEAGRRSALKARRHAWGWPAVAAALAILSVGQFLTARLDPTERVVERSVPTTSPAPEASMPAEAVVILTRRPPAPRFGHFDEPPLRPRRFEREGPETLPGPAFLAASARLGELPQNSILPLKASDGLDREFLSRIGGPL